MLNETCRGGIPRIYLCERWRDGSWPRQCIPGLVARPPRDLAAQERTPTISREYRMVVMLCTTARNARSKQSCSVSEQRFRNSHSYLALRTRHRAPICHRRNAAPAAPCDRETDRGPAPTHPPLASRRCRASLAPRARGGQRPRPHAHPVEGTLRLPRLPSATRIVATPIARLLLVSGKCRARRSLRARSGRAGPCAPPGRQKCRALGARDGWSPRPAPPAGSAAGAAFQSLALGRAMGHGARAAPPACPSGDWEARRLAWSGDDPGSSGANAWAPLSEVKNAGQWPRGGASCCNGI